ncbi:hypothetical protein PtA15_18A438 [Puccinia triticina]|uniref:BTB domain-containing protein n=1 Tax=Puccinia triticina TaxID=208348 RepID=A0ABY7DAM0_9BASI|nr:uncharacterized protein PtA15_18A438 [Puccinia triticina]WAQ93377.1 hypothetical protein PtA15_18A438 [Puccinia triticina]
MYSQNQNRQPYPPFETTTPPYYNSHYSSYSNHYNSPRTFAQTPPPPPPPLTNTIRPDSRQSSAVLHQQPPNSQQHLWNEEWPRHWAWTGVDIPIHNLRALSQNIEQKSAAGHIDLSPDDIAADISSGEVLSYSFGKDRWKVEVVKAHSRRPSAPSTPTNTTHPQHPRQRKPTNTAGPDHHLSLYLTCHELEVDWPVSRAISTSILISIKEPRIPLHLNPITDLGSPAEGWIWRTCCDEHSFEREREVWECHDFPSLSSLLENPRVALFDSCILTIQIGSPATVSIPQIPNASYVPQLSLPLSLIPHSLSTLTHPWVSSILESLESLLDDPNTSDLQILVTEIDERMGPDEEEEHGGRRRAAPTRFRKRLLYAHSSILKRRSEYFQTMLADEASGGGWAESSTLSSSTTSSSLVPKHSGLERKLGLIRIADFDFVTVYWLVRWLYSNRIFFSDHEDVRGQCQRGAVLASFDEAGRSPVVDPWVWQTHGDHPRGDVSRAGEEGPGGGSREPAPQPEPAPRQPAASASASSSRRAQHPTMTNTPHGFPPFSAVPKPSEPVLSSPTTPLHAPLHQGPKRSSDWVGGDPHLHPVHMAPKASAFSVYRLAHRYELTDLQHIAITHLCSHLTPASAFPILLASFVFPELHAQVKAYCLAHYFEILSQPEFSRCYSEVGEGLWEHGGEVLLSFTMSLMPGPAVRV